MILDVIINHFVVVIIGQVEAQERIHDFLLQFPTVQFLLNCVPSYISFNVINNA